MVKFIMDDYPIFKNTETISKNTCVMMKVKQCHALEYNITHGDDVMCKCSNDVICNANYNLG